MKAFAHAFGITLAGLFWLVAAPAIAADVPTYPVGGLTPYQRPAGAPVTKMFERGDAWRTAALAGVSQPYPDSIVRLLDSQGAWYTPFTHPGIPGPYDLRGRHVSQKIAP